jgi:hypothetical protein
LLEHAVACVSEGPKSPPGRKKRKEKEREGKKKTTGGFGSPYLTEH